MTCLVPQVRVCKSNLFSCSILREEAAFVKFISFVLVMGA